MCSFLNSNSKNVRFNNYLSACDLVNKYCLKNLHESPKLSEVVLEFSSANILAASESGNRKELDSELQTKAFFLLYILSCEKPFINLNKIKMVKDTGFDYSVKIVLSSKEELDSFLRTMFVENWNLLLSEDFRLIKNSSLENNKSIQSNRRFLINTTIPSTVFFELETFLNKKIFGLNSKNLSMKVNFVFENKAKNAKRMSLMLIKNLPFFWATNTK